MKKILFSLLISLFFISGVNAETNVDITYSEFVSLKDFQCSGSTCTYLQNYYFYNNFNQFYKDSYNKEIFDNLYTDLMNYYNTNYKDNYPYYTISLSLLSKSNTEFELAGVFLSLKFFSSLDSIDLSGNGLIISNSYYDNIYYNIDNSNADDLSAIGFIGFVTDNLNHFAYIPTLSYESNFDKIYSYNYIWNIYNSPNDLLFSLTYGDVIPNFNEIVTILDSYLEVNLDDYHYVLLNLKDYSKKEAFETNMQVKGSIGITPIYEFGTAEKTEITDICNISYSDFTDYRFFVLKNDLINNAVYAVKGCEENSSFRYDSSIFNITYVTDENVNDPVITFGGIDYHTIPFDKLSNTVNKNTEEGFIPGESEKFNPIDSLVDHTSSFWNSLSTFMSLVTKFFNTLPIEIRAISITTFATACTLGLLKILKS